MAVHILTASDIGEIKRRGPRQSLQTETTALVAFTLLDQISSHRCLPQWPLGGLVCENSSYLAVCGPAEPVVGMTALALVQAARAYAPAPEAEAA